MRFARRICDTLLRQLGGRAQARVIVLMALMLSLDRADAGAIGGMAAPLQRSLGIGSAELGLLFTVESAAAAAGTSVFGWLVDRETRLPARTIVLWGVVMIACGTATSYAYLLVTQLALGAVIAAAQPAVASLVGDYCPPDSRGKVYGFILSASCLERRSASSSRDCSRGSRGASASGFSRCRRPFSRGRSIASPSRRAAARAGCGPGARARCDPRNRRARGSGRRDHVKAAAALAQEEAGRVATAGAMLAAYLVGRH